LIHPAKLLKELGINPLKHLGQNFQVDTHVVENAADVIPQGAQILEIGPGLGAWTEIFIARGHKLVLAEKDRTLANKWRADGRVELFEGDFLEMDLEASPQAECTAAIGNLPFYITSEILLRLIVDSPRITHGLFGIQLEVAERIVSAQGSSLAIALGAVADIRLTGRISRHSFYPAPNVDAAIIAVKRHANILPRPNLRILLKAAFWGKRKILRVALKKNPFWQESDVGERWFIRLAQMPGDLQILLEKRADDLSVKDFCALYDFLES